MRRSANKAAVMLVAMALLCCRHAVAQSATASPVERLVAMEGLLFGSQQQGPLLRASRT